MQTECDESVLGLASLGSGAGGHQMAAQGVWSRADGPPSDKNICTAVLKSQLEGQMDLPAVMFMVLIDLRFIMTGVRQTNTSTHLMSAWCTAAHVVRRSRQQAVSVFPRASSQ